MLDGEIVALVTADPARFQELQGAHARQGARRYRALPRVDAGGLILFDILVDGDDVLVNEPWTERTSASFVEQHRQVHL